MGERLNIINDSRAFSIDACNNELFLLFEQLISLSNPLPLNISLPMHGMSPPPDIRYLHRGQYPFLLYRQVVRSYLSKNYQNHFKLVI